MDRLSTHFDREGLWTPLLLRFAEFRIGEQLLAQSDALTALLTQCQIINVNNGQSILIQQAATANQLKILTGGEPPALYDARGSTSKLAKPRPLSQA